MSRYYKAEDVETALVFSGLCDGKTCGEVKKVLNSIPTIDRLQGEWIVHSNGKMCDCSVCNESYDRTFEYVDEWNYCPNCGADMKGDPNEI